MSEHPAVVHALEQIQKGTGTCIHYATCIGKDVDTVTSGEQERVVENKSSHDAYHQLIKNMRDKLGFEKQKVHDNLNQIATRSMSNNFKDRRVLDNYG